MKSVKRVQLCSILIAVFLSACSSGVDRDYEVLAKQNLACPDGAKVEFDSWGGKPTGMIAQCKLDHGPYVVAVRGRVVLKGESRMGKPVGDVTVFEETGEVQRQGKQE